RGLEHRRRHVHLVERDRRHHDDGLRIAVQAGDGLPEWHQLGLERRVADRDLIRGEPERRSWPRAFMSAHSLPILVAWVLGEHAGRTARRSAHDTTLWPHVRRRRWAGGLARGPILGGCARLGSSATAV